eukprot:5960717-Pyramimonas_sp.AAC.1
MKTANINGRVVFDGSDVRDQNRDVALFVELSSNPSTMQASAAAYTYGLFEGHDIQQADAKQADTLSRSWGYSNVAFLAKRRVAARLERHAKPRMSLHSFTAWTS